MNPPFSTAEFLEVFARYNREVWPGQVAFSLLAVLVLWLAWRPRERSGMAVAGVLAFLWAWMGVVYHGWYFSRINPAAYLFAGAFLLQAALLLHAGLSRAGPTFRARMDAAGIAGVVMVAYALIVYPLIGYAVGQRYPAAPTFGLPCPTTIFTFGVLLWAAPRVPPHLLVIPTAWSVLGVFAARSHGIVQDYALPVAALIACGMAVWMRREARRAPGGRLGADPHSCTARSGAPG